MDYIVDEGQYRLESLSSYTQYLSTLPQQKDKETDDMQIEDNVKTDIDVAGRCLTREAYAKFAEDAYLLEFSGRSEVAN